MSSKLDELSRFVIFDYYLLSIEFRANGCVLTEIRNISAKSFY